MVYYIIYNEIYLANSINAFLRTIRFQYLSDLYALSFTINAIYMTQ